MSSLAEYARERPIIFAGESVRAILAGRKTQTRRVLPESDMGSFLGPLGEGHDPRQWGCIDAAGGHHPLRMRYGEPGDRLWVREAWTRFDRDATMQSVRGGPFVPTGDYLPGGIGYRADIDQQGQVPVPWDSPKCFRTPRGWKSPIFMPREFSRLSLEIVEIRVQRLQEISEEDCYAEGIPKQPAVGGIAQAKWTRALFRRAWNEINFERGPWSSNPWVWAITFRRVA